MARFVIAALLVIAGSVSTWASDVVATRTLKVGSILTATDIKPGDGAAARHAAMVGLELRRAVYAGHPVSETDLGPPTLVRRNEIVVMNYSSGALDIRTEGRALSRGGAGETVEVMNLASRQTVRAIVSGPGAVEVRR